MNFELAIFGIITGLTSGFFGVGGGMVLVPILLVYGFVMKEAVAISIMQMVFSSIYGSFLNAKKAKNVIKDGTILGIGGSLGGIASGYMLSSISNESLQYLFISNFMSFNLIAMQVPCLRCLMLVKLKLWMKKKVLIYPLGFI